MQLLSALIYYQCCYQGDFQSSQSSRSSVISKRREKKLRLVLQIGAGWGEGRRKMTQWGDRIENIVLIREEVILKLKYQCKVSKSRTIKLNLEVYKIVFNLINVY